jgi:uncharacterized membrane protein SirB2
MEPTPDTAKLIRALLLPGTVVIAMEAYYIVHSPPHERRRRIFFAIVTLVAFVTIAVLSIRKRTSSPENPRLSHFTLAGIALVIIIIAVLFRHL